MTLSAVSRDFSLVSGTWGLNFEPVNSFCLPLPILQLLCLTGNQKKLLGEGWREAQDV